MDKTHIDDAEHAEPLDVIAVGAHPDDVEIGCGGTLARLVQLGYRVGIVDLTNGEPTPLCDDPAIRLEEARAAAEVLGVQVRYTLPLPNRELLDTIEARMLLAYQLRRHRPRLVLSLLGMTPLASPDHWQARLITDAAVFYSRLSKWDARFAGLPVHRVKMQYYFRLGAEAAPSSASSYELIMDIGETLEKKLASIACYRTQFPEAKHYVFDRVQANAVSLGQTVGFRAGESFVSPRAVGTHDLMRTL